MAGAYGQVTFVGDWSFGLCCDVCGVWVSEAGFKWERTVCWMCASVEYYVGLTIYVLSMAVLGRLECVGGCILCCDALV